MRTKISKTGKIVIAIAMMLLSSGLYAQQEHGMKMRHREGCDSTMCHQGIPNLTADQKEKISTLRISHMKEMKSLRDDLNIKQAELEKYRTSDNPDVNLINKTIDEIGKIRTEMQKKQVSHQLSVRALLTDEQKVYFDSKHQQRHEKGEMKHCETMRHTMVEN